MFCERLFDITNYFPSVRINDLLFVFVILAINYSHFIDELTGLTVFLPSKDLDSMFSALLLPESRDSFRSHTAAFGFGLNAG